MERRKNLGRFLYKCLECNYKFMLYHIRVRYERIKCPNCDSMNVTMMIGRRKDDT